jgi:hypothetical protein
MWLSEETTKDIFPISSTVLVDELEINSNKGINIINPNPSKIPTKILKNKKTKILYPK